MGLFVKTQNQKVVCFKVTFSIGKIYHSSTVIRYSSSIGDFFLFHKGGGHVNMGPQIGLLVKYNKLVICGHKVVRCAARAVNISIADIFYVCSVGRASKPLDYL